ncbi:HAD-IC family P-type ATPase [Candidatus Falkowbacteria bacterium]|jgi:P-type Ca2+ transporter type 2C|nr:HAD-IC family P-type ATPase [Candidatus Falkowbacteria bacterium]MBT4433287.1 HAD-IC family P-type ATPase [Candidatus Falkowbacteria bacterium]
MKTNFHSLEIKEVFQTLKSKEDGLSDKEAKKRLFNNGPNELPKEEKISSFFIFLKQLSNPVIYILIAAGLISLVTGHIFDSLFIVTVILFSSIIGFFQEKKADESIEKLRNMVKYEIEVIRDNKKRIIPSEEVVIGDVIVLNHGDKVPADARILETQNLEINEAMLTGESVPEIKQKAKIILGLPMAERTNMVYAGTTVVKGIGKAIVTAVAKKTELGKIASLVKGTDDVASPLQKKIKKFSTHLGVALVFLNIVIFFFGWLTGRDLYEMFLVSVAVVVAAVPEGLLPALVVILAVGMQKILKKQGLVKKMMAAETLGSVSVICADKTGTLTQGEMRVDRIITEDFILHAKKENLKNIINKEEAPNHYLALKAGLLCNDVFVEDDNDKMKEPVFRGNPTEKALYLAGTQAGFEKDELEKEEKRIAEIPFDSEYKFMATLHTTKKKDFVMYVKGAPEKIIDFASYIRVKENNVKLTSKYKEKITEQYLSLTAQGLRVIAIGYKEFPKNVFSKTQIDFDKSYVKGITFVGFVALLDPLRPDAKESINYCLKAGIKPVIITGDHRLTAKTIAFELGLEVEDRNILVGSELDKMDDKKLFARLKDIIIFARVEPRHKIRIVKMWQSSGAVVAMTGDGVNDSPAIKAADIGIALGSGTDIAKETADLVLLNNSFKVIVEAIKQGRIIFQNIKKIIIYVLTDSFTEMILITGSLLLGLPLPILPAQILWIKIIEDSVPSMALAFDDVEEGVMNAKKSGVKELLNKSSIGLIIFYAVIMDLSLLVIFRFYGLRNGDIDYARTITFVGLGIASLFYIYSVRGLKKSIFQINFFSNKLLTFSTVFGIFMFLMAIYVPFLNKALKTVPLDLQDWIVLCIYGLSSIIVYETGKKIFKQA